MSRESMTLTQANLDLKPPLWHRAGSQKPGSMLILLALDIPEAHKPRKGMGYAPRVDTSTEPEVCMGATYPNQRKAEMQGAMLSQVGSSLLR